MDSIGNILPFLGLFAKKMKENISQDFPLFEVVHCFHTTVRPSKYLRNGTEIKNEYKLLLIKDKKIK